MSDQVELPDVDIDVKEREKAVSLFPEAIPASQLTNKNELSRHNTGIHFQNIPVDQKTGLAAFPYEHAEILGFLKVDVIYYGAYDHIDTMESLDDLMTIAESDIFPWEWFQDERYFENENNTLKLTQLSRHYDLCQMYPPTSVMDVAILNALVRPRKKYMIGWEWDDIVENVWKPLPDEEGYFFKKSHAVAFALTILIHIQVINLIMDYDTGFYD